MTARQPFPSDDSSPTALVIGATGGFGGGLDAGLGGSKSSGSGSSDDSGCGCSVPGQNESNGNSLALLGLAGAAMVFSRRRRRHA